MRNSNLWILSILVIFFQLVPCSNKKYPDLSAQENSEAIEKYFTLQKLYFKWNEGLFGSRKFHENFLKKFLYDLLGEKIETDHNFMLETPEVMSQLTIKCKFKHCRWLYIFGKIDNENIKKLFEKDKNFYKKFWRSKALFSISGKVVKYRIGRDKYGDTIELYLDKITLKE